MLGLGRIMVLMYGVAILKRRLRPGKTYEDFRKAWFHETGFATANRMLTMLNIADPSEVIVIGITRADSMEDAQRVLAIDQQERGASPLDEVIEPDIDRTFGLLVAEDDFSGDGSLEYRPAEIDGRQVDLKEVEAQVTAVRQLLRDYLRH